MKKIVILSLMFLCIFDFKQLTAQSEYEAAYNAGYLIGASIRNAINNKREREAEEARQEQARYEAERAYELERQRIANERAAQEAALRAAEAERQRAEAERQRIEAERQRAEAENRQRMEAQIRNERLSIMKESNSDPQTLTVNNDVEFYNDEGMKIRLMMEMDYNNNCLLIVINNGSKDYSLVCNNVSLKILYDGETEECVLSDACSINIGSGDQKILNLSDVFFGVKSNKAIKDVKVRFVGTQIKQGKGSAW